MSEEKFTLQVLLRTLTALIPFLLGMPGLAMLLCAYNVAMAGVAGGTVTYAISAVVALFGAAIGGLIMGGMSGIIAGITLGAEIALVALACVFVQRTRQDFLQGTLLAAGGYLIPMLCGLSYQAHKAGQSIVEFCALPTMEDLTPVLSQMVQLTPEQTQLLEEMVSAVSEFVMLMLPAAFVISAMMMAYIVMWFVNHTLRRLGIGLKHSFGEIHLHFIGVLVLAAAVAAAYFTRQGTAFAVAVNLLVIVGFVFCIAGLSLVDFYLRRALPHVWQRALCYVLALGLLPGMIPIPIVQLVPGALLLLCGVVDAVIPLRRVRG